LLEQEVDRPMLLAACRGERAFVEDTIRALDDGRLGWPKVVAIGVFSDGRSWTGWAETDRWLNRLDSAASLRSNAVAQLRLLTWVIECLKESPDGLRARSADWAALRGSRGAGRLINILERFVTGDVSEEAR